MQVSREPPTPPAPPAPAGQIRDTLSAGRGKIEAGRPSAGSTVDMPYQALHELVPEIADLQARVLDARSRPGGGALRPDLYALVELYCDEVGCDCRRVMFYVTCADRPGPEAVIVWGWESPGFYVRWLGEDEEATLDQLKGPALNLGSPQGEGAEALLGEIRQLLAWDSEYVALIKEHYRVFRSRLRREHFTPAGAWKESTTTKSSAGVASGGLVLEDNVTKTLAEAGIETTVDECLPAVGLEFDEDDEIVPPGETLLVTDGEFVAPVTVKPISELFSGDRQPPVFGDAPPREYVPFFLAIERAAYEYCVGTDERVRDKEFVKAYNDLRRRPDGRGQCPVVPHLQAAARLYMSLRDVSQAEYEGVMGRLSRSARAFAMGYTSTNYFDAALEPMFGRGG